MISGRIVERVTSLAVATFLLVGCNRSWVAHPPTSAAHPPADEAAAERAGGTSTALDAESAVRAPTGETIALLRIKAVSHQERWVFCGRIFVIGAAHVEVVQVEMGNLAERQLIVEMPCPLGLGIEIGRTFRAHLVETRPDWPPADADSALPPLPVRYAVRMEPVDVRSNSPPSR